jgi:hypothetical protein
MRSLVGEGAYLSLRGNSLLVTALSPQALENSKIALLNDIYVSYIDVIFSFKAMQCFLN